MAYVILDTFCVLAQLDAVGQDVRDLLLMPIKRTAVISKSAPRLIQHLVTQTSRQAQKGSNAPCCSKVSARRKLLHSIAQKIMSSAVAAEGGYLVILAVVELLLQPLQGLVITSNDGTGRGASFRIAAP